VDDSSDDEILLLRGRALDTDDEDSGEEDLLFQGRHSDGELLLFEGRGHESSANPVNPSEHSANP
jgi:hypothetical protein